MIFLHSLFLELGGLRITAHTLAHREREGEKKEEREGEKKEERE